MNNLVFNPKSPAVLHIDLNSCFATIEQQANPLLRGKPVVVAAYTTPRGCIIAPSIEAKKLGIKVGMRVKDGKSLCPDLIVLPPDPWKYRNVHLALRRIVSDYTSDFNPKSIDEFVLNLEGYPSLTAGGIRQVARDIKTRIRKEAGEWLTVSIGIAPNRFLAKLASSLHKPDGLDEINKDNFLDCYLRLRLTDLPYIKTGNALRLNRVGIYSVVDFYNAPLWQLKVAFASINSYYWHLRLHGYEIDDVTFARRSYGNSYALPKFVVSPEELSPVLCKLVEKMGFRLRNAGYQARGIHLSLIYKDWSFWHKGVTYPRVFFDSRDIYKEAYRLLTLSPRKPVRQVFVSVFNLVESNLLQLDLFENVIRKQKLTQAVDKVNERWGNYILTPARVVSASGAVPDRIAFGQSAELTPQALLAGGVKELEEFTLN